MYFGPITLDVCVSFAVLINSLKWTFFISVQGIRDLFWLPVEQYRKDGRIVRGLQRGAHSFTTSTAMAALELTNRLVQTVQVEFICNVLFRAHEAETYRSHGSRFRV